MLVLLIALKTCLRLVGYGVTRFHRASCMEGWSLEVDFAISGFCRFEWMVWVGLKKFRFLGFSDRWGIRLGGWRVLGAPEGGVSRIFGLGV